MKILCTLAFVITLVSCSYPSPEDKMITRLCTEVGDVSYSAATLKDLGVERSRLMSTLSEEFDPESEFYTKIDSLIHNIWLTPTDKDNKYYRTPEDLSSEIEEHCLENPNLYLDI